MIAIINIRVSNLKPEELVILTQQVQQLAEAYNSMEHSIMIVPEVSLAPVQQLNIKPKE